MPDEQPESPQTTLENEVWVLNLSDDHSYVNLENGDPIAEIETWMEERKEARARLIAAAPDLLAALRDLVRQLPKDERLADFDLDLAEAAECKAVGESPAQ